MTCTEAYHIYNINYVQYNLYILYAKLCMYAIQNG